MMVGPDSKLVRRRWFGAGAVILALGLGGIMSSPLEAQEGAGAEAAIMQPGTFPFDTLPSDPSPAPMSGRGAFVRSLLVPGWGQVASGAITRGGFYFAAQSASFWMIRKSALARGEAKTFTRLERDITTARLVATGVDDPVALRQAVDSNAEVRRWEGLSDLRSQQVEDWVALSIFLALIGAADAVVASHLQDYPEPLTFRVLPSRTGERIELGFVLPVGGVGR